MKVSGLTVIKDPYIQPELKYPTGRKDGNKLGLRKRKEKTTSSYIDIETQTMFVSEEQYKLLKDLV